MTSRLGVLIVLLTLAAPAAAQETLDVSKLPLDLERIQKVLKQGAVREERDGLNLRYTVEVFGQAPPLELFTPGESLTTGPVPDSAPTHREMVDHVTPREYRSPPADLGALFRWLAERAKK
jgi:hypothetical protein